MKASNFFIFSSALFLVVSCASTGRDVKKSNKLDTQATTEEQGEKEGAATQWEKSGFKRLSRSPRGKAEGAPKDAGRAVPLSEEEPIEARQPSEPNEVEDATDAEGGVTKDFPGKNDLLKTRPQTISADFMEERDCDDVISDFVKTVKSEYRMPPVIKRLPVGLLIYVSSAGRDISTYMLLFPAGVLSPEIEHSPEGTPFSCVKEGSYYSGLRS